VDSHRGEKPVFSLFDILAKAKYGILSTVSLKSYI